MIRSPFKETARQVLPCGARNVEDGRGPGQLPWYEFAARLVANKSVLDAGTGLGRGLEILRRTAAGVEGQDLDPRLARPDIQIRELAEIPSKSFDVVVSIDVIEHVEDAKDFVRQLARIAREAIFVTTPNWTASRCQWPYHVREYTPRQLEALLQPVGAVALFKGTPDGSKAFRVQYKRFWFAMNDLRVGVTALPTQVLNNLIPVSWRIHSHLGAWVELEKE